MSVICINPRSSAVFFRCVAASVFMERRDCVSICVKLSFIDRITGLTGYEYDNILSILSKELKKYSKRGFLCPLQLTGLYLNFSHCLYRSYYDPLFHLYHHSSLYHPYRATFHISYGSGCCRPSECPKRCNRSRGSD